jgi:hypothetical protein
VKNVEQSSLITNIAIPSDLQEPIWRYRSPIDESKIDIRCDIEYEKILGAVLMDISRNVANYILRLHLQAYTINLEKGTKLFDVLLDSLLVALVRLVSTTMN